MSIPETDIFEVVWFWMTSQTTAAPEMTETTDAVT